MKEAPLKKLGDMDLIDHEDTQANLQDNTSDCDIDNYFFSVQSTQKIRVPVTHFN